MNNPKNQPQTPVSLVFWMIWFSIFVGLFILQFFVAGGIPKGANVGQAPTLLISIAAVLAVVSMAIRFVVIPKITSIEKLLPAMIVGLALAEGVGFIGMFALGKEFPETRSALFIASVSAVLAFAPIYVNGLQNRRKMR